MRSTCHAVLVTRMIFANTKQGVTCHLLSSHPPPTTMHSRPSNDSEAEDPPTGEEEAFLEDDDLEASQTKTPYLKPIRIPPRIQTPPSPSLSISTTTSELELEQGEALLKVKRAQVKEEDSGDPLHDLEVISSDESEKPAPKKRKICSTGTKTQGREVKKSGTKTYPYEGTA